MQRNGPLPHPAQGSHLRRPPHTIQASKRPEGQLGVLRSSPSHARLCARVSTPVPHADLRTRSGHCSPLAPGPPRARLPAAPSLPQRAPDSSPGRRPGSRPSPLHLQAAWALVPQPGEPCGSYRTLTGSDPQELRLQRPLGSLSQRVQPPSVLGAAAARGAGMAPWANV